jgi:hypothetical protein
MEQSDRPLLSEMSSHETRGRLLAAQHIPGKGRGVVATQYIRRGETLEVSPVASFSASDCELIRNTSFFEYYFVRPDEYTRPDQPTPGYVIFGLSSICNHSHSPNAAIEWVSECTGLVAYLRAVRDVQIGEEITVYYTNLEEYDGWRLFLP